MQRTTIAFALAFVVAGCGSGSPELEAPAVVQQGIKSGSPVEPAHLFWRSMAFVLTGQSLCTGVIIDRNHILTAAHCNVSTASNVVYYWSDGVGVYARWVLPASVISAQDAGSNPMSDPLADIKIVEVSSTPSYAIPALIASSYPGDGTYVWMVGAGEHDNQSNPNRQLKWRGTTLYRYEPQNHKLLTASSDLDGGDSGSPIFTWDSDAQRLVIHGIHSGVDWHFDWGWAYRGIYTPVYYADYQSWILSNLSTWSADFGLEYDVNRPAGDYRFVYYPDWRSCPLECRYDGRCQAFSFGYDPSASQWQCWLKSVIPQQGPLSGWYSGHK